MLIFFLFSFLSSLFLQPRLRFTWFLELFILITRAAYKGFADTIRLLLFRDASQVRQDKDGILFWHLIPLGFSKLSY